MIVRKNGHIGKELVREFNLKVDSEKWSKVKKLFEKGKVNAEFDNVLTGFFEELGNGIVDVKHINTDNFKVIKAYLSFPSVISLDKLLLRLAEQQLVFFTRNDFFDWFFDYLLEKNGVGLNGKRVE